MKQETELQAACRDLLYLIGKKTGVIWLVKRLPMLRFKPPYADRDAE